jgi:tRNA nucleotidyltransferase (CCA-adding enzyme)
VTPGPPAAEPTCRWEHFEHRADVGVRGIGPTKERAFEQAALAMTAVVVDPCELRPGVRVDVACEDADDELLLVDWLNALIYEMATRKLLFGRFEVRFDGPKLTGTAWGEKVDVRKHQPAVEVKGATLTELRVERDADGRWIAQCVVDV